MVLSSLDVRAKYLFANTFFDLLNYITEGPKTDNYPAYCKINYLIAKRNSAVIQLKTLMRKKSLTTI